MTRAALTWVGIGNESWFGRLVVECACSFASERIAVFRICRCLLRGGHRDGKILSVLGILLVMGALHAALFHPNRYPLLLAHDSRTEA